MKEDFSEAEFRAMLVSMTDRPPFSVEMCVMIPTVLMDSKCLANDPKIPNADYTTWFMANGSDMPLRVNRAVDIAYIAKAIKPYFKGGDDAFWEWISENFSNSKGRKYKIQTLKNAKAKSVWTTNPPDNARMFVELMDKTKQL